MVYRFIVMLLLLPQIGFANSFDAYNIKPTVLKSFYRSFHKIHPKGHIQKITPLGGESIDQVFKILVLEESQHTYFVRFLNRKNKDLNR